MVSLRRRSLIVLAVALCLAARTIPLASEEPTLTEDQIKQFLLKAKVMQAQADGERHHCAFPGYPD
jgi:hypothetical protein